MRGWQTLGRCWPTWRAGLVAVGIMAAPAWASLWPGSAAPDFTLTMALAGKTSTFSLGKALQNGPVVLYFYPAAFTPGCSIEAHEFAEAIDAFKAEGATVVGASGDNLKTLKRFSKAGCQGRFGVLSDAGLKVATQYDALDPFADSRAERVSYVITPDHRVYFTLASANPMAHISATLQAVKRWRAEQKAPVRETPKEAPKEPPKDPPSLLRKKVIAMP